MADDNVFLKNHVTQAFQCWRACVCLRVCVHICPKLRHCISWFLEAIFISYIKSGTVGTKPENMHVGQYVYIQRFIVFKKGVSYIFIFVCTRLQNNSNLFFKSEDVRSLLSLAGSYLSAPSVCRFSLVTVKDETGKKLHAESDARSGPLLHANSTGITRYRLKTLFCWNIPTARPLKLFFFESLIIKSLFY